MYGIEYWFDDIVKIWGTVEVDKMRVKSFMLNKIPEAVTKAPCAITFVRDGDNPNSLAGSAEGFYQGVTEFHLTLDLMRSKMPFCMKFPDKIVAAAASHLTLNGKVVSFKIGKWEIVELTWGGEPDHFGIKVPWTVQENQTGKYTIGV